MSDTSATHPTNPTTLQMSNLTFGVEFEFALAALEGTEDPHPNDTRQAYGLDYNPQKYDLDKRTAKPHATKNQYTLKESSKSDPGYSALKDWEDYMTTPPVWPVLMSTGIQRQWEEWAAQEDEIQPDWVTNVPWTIPAPAQEVRYQQPQYGRGVAYAQEHIVNTLTRAGFPARIGRKNDTPDVKSENWIIKLDKTIAGGHLDDKYVTFPIEITSPAYSFTSANIEKVMSVCRLLTRTYRINVNDSCGLHVHIGQGSKGFSFETLRNLFMVLWTFEPQIQMLHPVHRLKNTHFASDLRTDSHLASMFLTPLQGLVKLGAFGLRDEDELFDLVASATGYKAAYHTEYIRKPYRHAYKRTLEFRQHEATLDPERVENWIRVCAGLVFYAANRRTEDLMGVLKEVIGLSVERFSVQEILGFLGLEGQARFYGERLARWEFGAEGGRGKIWDSMRERNCEFEGESGFEGFVDDGFVDEGFVEDGSSASEGGWSEAGGRSGVPCLIKSDSASSEGSWGWDEDSVGEGYVEVGW